MVVPRLDVVQGLLLSVKLVERGPEEDTANKRKDTHDAVVPDEQPEEELVGERESSQGQKNIRVGRQGHECLAESVRNGGAEQEQGHDNRLHVGRRLCERVLKTGDGRVDLGDSDEHVGWRLDPNIERGGRATEIRSVVTTRGCLVDVVLGYRRDHH